MAVCDQNIGKLVYPFFSAIASCSFNSGEIEIGSGSMITNCNHNRRGSIRITDGCQIQHLNSNFGHIQIGDHCTIESINFNSSIILIGNNVEVYEIKNNSSIITLGNNCTVRRVENNSGIIEGGHCTVIPLTGNCSCGRIKLGEETALRTSLTRNVQDNNTEDRNYPALSKITSFSNNFGKVIIGGGSSIIKCDHNHGSIKVGDDCKIVTLNYNCSNIEIGDQLQIQTIGSNNSEIKIGDNAKVHLIKSNNRTIRLGNFCVVDRVEDNSGNIFGGIGTTIPRNGNNLNGQVEVGINWTSLTDLIKIKFLTLLTTPIRTWESTGNISHLFVPPTTAPTLGQVNTNTNKLQNSLNGISTPRLRNAASMSSTSSSVSVHSRSSTPLLPAAAAVAPGHDKGPQDDPLGEDCPICLENPRNVAFTCGHLCCKKCSKRLKNCHMCRKLIREKITLYA